MMNLNLIERIRDGFLSSSKEEVLKGTCSTEDFIRNCDVAFGAFKLSSWSGIDPDFAFQLVTRYWDYAENNPAADSPLTVDDALNAMSSVLLDETLEYLLDMPDEEFFLLITRVALGNMTNVAEEYSARFEKEAADDE